MTEFEKTKWQISKKAIEIASDIQKQEEQADRIQKVNIYLMRKYGEELLEEFKKMPDVADYIDNYLGNVDDKLKDSALMYLLFEKIAQEMNEEMPEPWYSYSLNGDR